MSFQSILSTEINLLDDSDEEKESKRDLSVCWLENMSLQSSFSTEIDLQDDSDEEKKYFKAIYNFLTL